jgi:TolA-binding protein
MNAKRWMFLSVLALALIAGSACAQRNGEVADTEDPAPRMEQEAERATETMRTEISDFRNRMERNLEQFDTTLQDLEDRIEKREGQTREQLQQELDTLRQEKEQFQDRLENLENGTRESMGPGPGGPESRMGAAPAAAGGPEKEDRAVRPAGRHEARGSAGRRCSPAEPHACREGQGRTGGQIGLSRRPDASGDERSGTGGGEWRRLLRRRGPPAPMFGVRLCTQEKLMTNSARTRSVAALAVGLLIMGGCASNGGVATTSGSAEARRHGREPRPGGHLPLSGF